MLIKKGAEAYLYKENWYEKQIIRKFRRPKSYRILELDQQIRTYRTIHEAKLLAEARKVGVPTPIVYQVDIPNTTIIMEFIEGERIKELFLSSNDSMEICMTIGNLVGRLHNNGIVHGDLTTSNMILSRNKLFLIDFGLGDFSNSIEAFGVDLHLLRRALESTHFKNAKKFFQEIQDEYIREMDSKGYEVINRLEEILTRGRYVIRQKE
ncbi:MAG: Kae1-associated serine/threonine protein kinase [Candidatus Helarchaeota archaeon]|nr:Kae1-associated serine/threonine protein kinase [Candidatus Helarchaeota archaeon]